MSLHGQVLPRPSLGLAIFAMPAKFVVCHSTKLWHPGSLSWLSLLPNCQIANCSSTSTLESLLFLVLQSSSCCSLTFLNFKSLISNSFLSITHLLSSNFSSNLEYLDFNTKISSSFACNDFLLTSTFGPFCFNSNSNSDAALYVP